MRDGGIHRGERAEGNGGSARRNESKKGRKGDGSILCSPIASYAYAPYGQALSEGSGGTVFQFTGRENDGPANLYYYRSRYYNPGLNRFISEDSIGIAGGINLYAYVDGNPTGLVDPTGEFGIPGAIAGAIVGGVSGALGAYTSGGNVWAGAAIGIAGGAFVGGAGQYFTGVLGHMALRASIGGAANMAVQFLNGRGPCPAPFNGWSVAGSVVGGALGGYIAPGAWGTKFIGSIASQVAQRGIAGLPGASVSSTYAIVGTQIGKQKQAAQSSECGCQ